MYLKDAVNMEEIMFLRKMPKTCHKLADKVKNCLSEKKCLRQVGPLSDKGKSGKIRICQVTGDRKLCARMASMGVYPGLEADLICPENGGQCLLKIQGSTLSLDRSVSENILVSTI